MDGAGCLVILGILLLIPVGVYSFYQGMVLYHRLSSDAAGATLAEVPGLIRQWSIEFWEWLRGRSSHGKVSPLLVLFIAAYLVLFWQWIWFLLHWRPRLATPALWIVSTAYFLAAIAAFFVSTSPTPRPGMDPEQASNEFTNWLPMAGGFATLCGIFICALIPLWVISARARAKSARNFRPDVEDARGHENPPRD